tara:strand:- start:84 stop:248 length:165 start_codon:yes stop_codon:yes gene_type:complete
MERQFRIVSWQMLVQWSDSTKDEVLLNEMPKDLASYVDAWLSQIEDERNKAEAG